ncbi:MAG: DUF4198 domain-containing protein [Gemmatimonadales bacterium]
MKKVLVALLACAVSLAAHDFWLVPNAFRIATDAELVIHGQTGSSFPSSISAVTVDRVATARVLSARSNEGIIDLGVAGNSLRLRHRPTSPGQILVAVTLHPRSIPESPESFRTYLTLEGAPEALARYEREGLLPTDSIVRRYAKYAKTIVEVGESGPRVFDRVAGHPLEFIPLSDPATARAGDTIRFRMVFLGAPLPGGRGHVSVAASADSAAAYHDVPFVADTLGEFGVALVGPGVWNVRALHIVPARRGSGADWDVHWATFVWGTGQQE